MSLGLWKRLFQASCQRSVRSSGLTSFLRPCHPCTISQRALSSFHGCAIPRSKAFVNKAPIPRLHALQNVTSASNHRQCYGHPYSTEANSAKAEKTNVDHSRFLSEASPQSKWSRKGDPNEATITPKEEEEEWNNIPEGRGKLSPTSSHLFKLIIPLGHLSAQRIAHNSSSADPVPPTVFLLHPSQPLSHVARLIGTSLVPASPTISFRASTNSKSTKPQTLQWSDATDVGDFTRDAARATEFVIHIANARPKGADKETGESNTEIIVEVPSFADRTRFLRRRLEVIGEEISGMEDLKLMCDREAHRSARRLAVTGFLGLVAYWAMVARLTFWDLGWDVMEPVTYLSGLSMVICGYLWFLYQGREVSYSSVLDRSISTRREALYKQHGFDIDRWVELVGEAKQVRSEISKIAQDYDRWSGKPRAGRTAGEEVKEEAREDTGEGQEERHAKKQGKTEGEKIRDEAKGEAARLTKSES